MKLERVYLADRTLGSWYDDAGEFVAKTLELPWKENKRGISCIPEGVYIVTKEPPIPANDPQGRKERPYTHFRIKEVPGRYGILVHRGINPKHSKGCILVGSRFADVTSDAPILESSGVKLQFMADTFPDKFTLTIVKK